MNQSLRDTKLRGYLHKEVLKYDEPDYQYPKVKTRHMVTILRNNDKTKNKFPDTCTECETNFGDWKFYGLINLKPYCCKKCFDKNEIKQEIIELTKDNYNEMISKCSDINIQSQTALKREIHKRGIRCKNNKLMEIFMLKLIKPKVTESIITHTNYSGYTTPSSSFSSTTFEDVFDDMSQWEYFKKHDVNTRLCSFC
jgi:hypothetical protein